MSQTQTQTLNLPLRPLGPSSLRVPPICLGTMTFGVQVDETLAHAILARSHERGLHFLDTAEMYPVPPSAATHTRTESYIGNWFGKNPGMRQQWTVATKVAGPSRGMPWVRAGQDPVLRKTDIISACDASLQRLQTDYIDLYQIHWPSRDTPMFGAIYFHGKDDPAQTRAALHEQLEALDTLVQAGKIRAIGLSNESPYGVHTFAELAKEHKLTQIASVQNPYCLTNRAHENGLDETLHHLGIGMLAYSPLGFGVLTGKYDEHGLQGPNAAPGRMSAFNRMREQRWARPESLAAARRYNQLARQHGLSPTQLALAFCYQSWRITSTIIGCTNIAQLDECLNAYATPTLSPELLQTLDTIRWENRDPAQ